MKEYKGFYIDRAIFKNEQDTDKFLENQALEAYKTACELFATHSNMANANYMNEKAEILVNNFGYTWEQLEEIEIQSYKAV